MRKSSKTKIVRAAQELFREKGYAGTSMRDIGERVGLLKASIYSHFPSKDALIPEVLDLTFDQIFAEQTATDDWAADYKALLDKLADTFIEVKRCVGLHLAYGMHEETESARLVTNFFGRCHDHLRKVLERDVPADRADSFAADTLAAIEGATLWLVTRNDASCMTRTLALLHEMTDALAYQIDPDATARAAALHSGAGCITLEEKRLVERVVELERTTSNLMGAIAGQIEAEACFK